MKELTSIREVAKLAGVSPATVSRVMNGTANVNEEKQKRVEAAIKETGFQPNELARALYKKSSKMIGRSCRILKIRFLVSLRKRWKIRHIRTDIGFFFAVRVETKRRRL